MASVFCIEEHGPLDSNYLKDLACDLEWRYSRERGAGEVLHLLWRSLEPVGDVTMYEESMLVKWKLQLQQCWTATFQYRFSTYTLGNERRQWLHFVKLFQKMLRSIWNAQCLSQCILDIVGLAVSHMTLYLKRTWTVVNFCYLWLRQEPKRVRDALYQHIALPLK